MKITFSQNTVAQYQYYVNIMMKVKFLGRYIGKWNICNCANKLEEDLRCNII